MQTKLRSRGRTVDEASGGVPRPEVCTTEPSAVSRSTIWANYVGQLRQLRSTAHIVIYAHVVLYCIVIVIIQHDVCMTLYAAPT